MVNFKPRKRRRPNESIKVKVDKMKGNTSVQLHTLTRNIQNLPPSIVFFLPQLAACRNLPCRNLPSAATYHAGTFHAAICLVPQLTACCNLPPAAIFSAATCHCCNFPVTFNLSAHHFIAQRQKSSQKFPF